MQTKVIGIVGGGAMGRGIAQLALQSGFQVFLYNRQSSGSIESQKIILKSLDKAVSKEKITAEEAKNFLAKLTCTQDFEEVVSKSDLVIENTPEGLKLKQEIFEKMGSLASAQTILATNTSSLSVTKIASKCSHPERVIGMHFFNPPIVMKLLEIVVPEKTSNEVYEEVHSIGKALGRTSIRVKDSPGFATSRLSVCIGLEAVRMLEENVANAADIDTAMEVGYRHPMGPLKLGDYVGLDVRLAVAEHLYKELKTETFHPPQLLKDKVAKGERGKKSGHGFYDWSD